jgi:hypothetical protein
MYKDIVFALTFGASDCCLNYFKYEFIVHHNWYSIMVQLTYLAYSSMDCDLS